MITLFNFTLRQMLVNRKIWLTVVMLGAPCALVPVIRSVEQIDRADPLWEMYHVLAHLLLISVLVPLVCMVHGTALLGADVEAKTIAYLTTRRMRRATVLLVKFVATALVLAVLCDLSMLGLHFCTLVGRDVPSLIAASAYHADWSPTGDLYQYLMFIPLGVVGFLAVFSLIGLLAARPLTFSVVYLITIELLVSRIPAQVAMYSLSYQLRAMLFGAIPRLIDLEDLPRDMSEQLYPKGASTWPELLGIVVIALVLAGVLATLRELLPTKVSRE